MVTAHLTHGTVNPLKQFIRCHFLRPHLTNTAHEYFHIFHLLRWELGTNWCCGYSIQNGGLGDKGDTGGNTGSRTLRSRERSLPKTAVTRTHNLQQLPLCGAAGHPISL